MTYYKAVQPDGTDFYTGRVNYLADGIGTVVTHPAPHNENASGYLSVSVSPSDCTGFRWPARLLVVEPVEPWVPEPSTLPSKRATYSLRVVAERPAHEIFGPNGRAVVAFFDSVQTLTEDEWDAARATVWGMDSATRNAALSTMWYAAISQGRNAALNAVRGVANTLSLGAVRGVANTLSLGSAELNAAEALLVRDLFSAEHFDILTAPMRAAGIDFDSLGTNERTP